MNEVAQSEASIASTAIVHPGVRLGSGVVIEDYCIVGYPSGKRGQSEPETFIGDNCHIRSHAVIYAGVSLGRSCHVAHGAYIREFTTIGDRSSVGINVVIEHHCEIGCDVRIQGQAGLAETTIVEDGAWIGPRVLTSNVLHPTCQSAKKCLAGPIIRKNAIIGGNVFISPDIEIGQGSLIGAGSVVIKSVPEKAVMFGVPARKVSDVGKLSCPYGLIEGSPYAKRGQEEEAVAAPSPTIPLVDLSLQIEQCKQEVRLAIDRVILNTRFIGGEEIDAFEGAFAKYCRANYAIGVKSGTVALELALRALGVGPGDEVITQPNSFIATVEAIAAVGAKPVFVDVDRETSAIDVTLVPAAITPATKAIIPVHLYGHIGPLEIIKDLAAAHGMAVVEDATQAHGAERGGIRAGGWGDVACFSFFPAKNLGAFGDAGAVVTSREDLAHQVRMVRDHGRTNKYVSALLGQNARLDTIQAAVLLVKLKHLDKWNDERRALADRYRQRLAELPLALPPTLEQCHDVVHLFVVRTPRRAGLQAWLSAGGIRRVCTTRFRSISNPLPPTSAIRVAASRAPKRYRMRYCRCLSTRECRLNW